MGSKIFNLKSLYLGDTVVRGARVSTKNAKSTRTLEINPGDEPKVKTGETEVNKEYLIQSSFVGNDLNGYGTFINNSDVIRGYTGAQNLFHGDRIKLDGDRTSYTVTGIQGNDVYILEKYSKEDIHGPDVITGSCSVWKTKLDSVKYESADTGISFNKDKSEWGITGAQMSDPIIAPSDIFNLDTGVDVRFQSGTSNSKPDIATVLSTYKTLVSNNTAPITDVSLSPLPFPHSSLQVFMGKTGEELYKAEESKDYIVNYTNGSEVIYPIPPYEERETAYIKFLGEIKDEVQISSLDASFNGNLAIIRKVTEGESIVSKPVQGILPTDELSIKVGGIEITLNEEYLLNYDAGIATFVEHNNLEPLIDTITYPKKLIWDGISVIKGVKEDEVENPENLIIPGVSGIKGIDHTLYFEDTDTNNLVRDIDFTIDPESGAFALNTPTRDNEAYLISYYVEGDDVKNEKLENNNPRLNCYPLIAESLVLTKKYTVLSDTGAPVNNTKILVEGIDFRASSITGFIELFPSNEATLEIRANYTPMAQINCVVQSIPNSLNYNYTIIDDVLTFNQDNAGSKRLIFKVNNPVVSVPKKILFDSDKVKSNYNFTGSILPEDILGVKTINRSLELNVKNAKYDDIKKEIQLDESLNSNILQDTDTVVGTYRFESDVLPYAPLVLIYTVINAGDSYFTIEGYDKTDSLKSGDILRIDNKDPLSSYYFLIDKVTYSKQSTRVDIFGSFPETIVDPGFYVFDSSVNWLSFSESVTVDTGTPFSSEQIVLNGGPLFIKANLKKDALLLVNNTDIYTITSVTIQGESAIVGISPPLRTSLSSNLKFSRLPVYEEGITTLPAEKLILNDTDEPAFTLWYNTPEGFEGSAKVLFVGKTITLEEYVSGIKNPVPYVFNLNDYFDIYTLAKSIQDTKSTFKDNVPNLGVPDYNPFTIVHSGKENYYLGSGDWRADTLKPFEEEAYINLPYTFKASTDLYKYTLLSFTSGKKEFLISDANVTTFFNPDRIIELINKASGRYFFSKVVSSEYVENKDTKVQISSTFTENMVDPLMYTCSGVKWEDLSNKLINIDYQNSKLQFSGYLNVNIGPGTLLQISHSYVFQVNATVQTANYFEINVNSVIEPKVTVENYTGYVKYSSVPVVFSDVSSPLNLKRLEFEKDYSIDNGIVELTTPIKALDRFVLSYMGLNPLFEYEDDDLTCSCRFLSYLPKGYNLDVYLEYINIDQFYIQKLTERKFSEIVTVPQIEQLIEQKGSAGGQGNDNGASSNSVENYEGGIADINYLLQDEYIKKQLYLRFYQWYKQRLRGLSAELQLGLGFKFGHSSAVGETGDYYSLDDASVETEDYTLTSDADVGQIDNGYSKFFPIGYEGQAPDYYHRFNNEYLSFNEVYCCNVTYKNDKNQIVKVGVIKSDRPYWNRTSDLVFKVWDEKYINKNLVGYYNVDVPEADRVFSPVNYTFLKVIDSGDKIKIDSFKNYYTISSITSPNDKAYEYILTKTPFTEKGIKTYNIVNNADVPFDTLMDNLPPDGYHIWVKRQEKEDFPMSDDFGHLGATAYGETIEGLLKDGRRIRKPSLANLLKSLFPGSSALEPPKNFKIMVKKDSEGDWEDLGSIDLTKLTFKEERNVDDVLDSLRYDFTEKFKVPPIPPLTTPYTVYDIKETDDKGFYRYFYLSLERVYDAGSTPGYYYSIVLRAKDRNWWVRVVDGGEKPIIGEYGFFEDKVYKNFYDPENIYKKLLLEKQAWQTEELIIRDLYDYNDKIARAFDQGDLNRKNSKYQQYLAMPDGGTVPGISDILSSRIIAYEKQLRFLTDAMGPVYKTLYPDHVHAENEASPEIALTFKQTQYALNLYNTFYNKMWFYYNLNADNKNAWKNNYVRWAMSLERGIIYQKSAKTMYDTNANNLTIGIQDVPTIKISLAVQSVYTIQNPKVSVFSSYDGKYIQIVFSIVDTTASAGLSKDEVCIVLLYNKTVMQGVPTIVYKTLTEICSEISSYAYNGTKLFIGEDIFEHFENNIASKLSYADSLVLDPIEGVSLSSTNVADHRSSDSRVLFLNKNIEDRVYTHEVRELPGFKLAYSGEYYFLKHGIPGLTITLESYYDKEDFKYGIFFDETGEKVLNLSYVESEETVYNVFKLYKEKDGVYTYKTLYELSLEINATYIFQASLSYSNMNYLCDTLISSSSYIDAEDYSVTPYITTNSAYSSLDNGVNQYYYRIYTDSASIKKIDFIFYNLILDGKRVYKDSIISDIFTFSLQKSDLSFKTLSELCNEISAFKYRGEHILSAEAVYEPTPKDNLSSTFIIADNSENPIGYDWETSVYVDTYTEAISGKDANSRTISNIKNAIFSFPMYTANGNPNKNAIEDIPVSGKWEPSPEKEVLEIGCIDGSQWSVSFSDYDAGDYKSYMAPQDILDVINAGKSITEEQYKQLKVIEDQPLVAVLKEIILRRYNGTIVNEARFNLRKYSTLNDLVKAIADSRYNDTGDLDPAGGRRFFTAKLIGDTNVEGTYKSNELSTTYTPIIKSFSVLMDDGSTIYKSNQLIGWSLIEIKDSIKIKQRVKLSEKRYSHGSSYPFKLNNPEKAYNDTLFNYPQGFRRDILAFDIYSWDVGAHYEVRDNWIYFKSSAVDYSYLNDLGQPNKDLGYGIPLSGSGHPMAPDRESLLDLINRINNNAVVNKCFYANLRFTRDEKDNPGYFEYNYLPNFSKDVPQSTLDHIKFKDDFVMKVESGSKYIFTDSNITIDDAADTLNMSCDWTFDYNYEKIFFFNKVSNLTLNGLANSINFELAPEIGVSLVEAVPLYDANSVSLLPTYTDKTLTTSESYLSINVGLTQVNALTIKIRNSSGSNFIINRATFTVPKSRDRLIIKCNITYRGTYNLIGYSIANYSIANLVNYLNTIKPYSDTIFPSLFSASSLSSGYDGYDTYRLMSINQAISIGGAYLGARLSDITAFKVLNMAPEATLTITGASLGLITSKEYVTNIPGDKNIVTFVDSIKGDFIEGFMSCDVLPLKIPSVTYGALNPDTYSLSSTNVPAHVYFGVMGDIKFVQISDYNLHVQYNYIKERLGMPWRNTLGQLEYDYYTPENFNENNPCALDLNNFLGYLRTGRYNQIKNSIINESVISNKYLWLYMKFHKEFGCDQKVKALKDMIQKGNLDISTLNQAL